VDPNKTRHGHLQARNDRSRAKKRRDFFLGGRPSNVNLTRGASYTDFPRNTAQKPGTEPSS
jgi:hypothetical protein